MCDPVCEHRFRSCHALYFILSMDDIGYWTTPSFVEPLTLRQLSVAGTLLVPANIRATTTRYRKVRRTQITLRQATLLSKLLQSSLNLHFLFGAIFSTGALSLRHLISREYGKQRAQVIRRTLVIIQNENPSPKARHGRRGSSVDAAGGVTK